MYQELTPLNPESLKDKALLPRTDYKFAAEQLLVELCYQEMSQAVTAMPLAFVQQEGQTQLVGLLSLTAGGNNFVTPEGHWATRYVPALFRAYPYAFVNNPNDPERPLVCVEKSYLIEADEEHTPLFNEDGSQSEDLTNNLNFLNKFLQVRNTTRNICNQLSAAGLLEPWPIKVVLEEKETTLTGVHRINEAALKALEPEVLIPLCRNGALAMAYAQLLSLERLDLLQKAASNQIAHQKKRQELDEKLDSLFNENDDEELSFGF